MNMDTRTIERLAKFAERVKGMEFHEFEGRLCFSGLFECPKHDKDFVKMLANVLNNATKDGFQRVADSLMEQIKAEASR